MVNHSSTVTLLQQQILHARLPGLPIDKREAYFWQSRRGNAVLGVVEHIGVAPTFDSLVNYLRGQNDREVSATFVVGFKPGEVALLVGSGLGGSLLDEQLTRAANHAGFQTFPNQNPLPQLGNPNWWTVGIEHVGYPGQTWTDAMIGNDVLCNEFIRTVLGPQAFTYILGHYIFDPRNRYSCPGDTFPWQALFGLNVQPHGEVIPEIPWAELESLPIGDFDAFAQLVRKHAGRMLS